MDSYAPAQEIEEATADQVEAIRAAGKRSVTKRLDLSDPRQINKEVVVALARCISPDRIAQKIEELLDQKRMTKSGLVPDVRAMEAGIKLALAYMVGLPTQRQEIISVSLDADSATGLAERLRASPALRVALRAALDQAEGENDGATVPK